MILSCLRRLRILISCSTVFFRFSVYSFERSMVFIAASSPVSCDRTRVTRPNAPLPSVRTCWYIDAGLRPFASGPPGPAAESGRGGLRRCCASAQPSGASASRWCGGAAPACSFWRCRAAASTFAAASAGRGGSLSETCTALPLAGCSPSATCTAFAASSCSVRNMSARIHAAGCSLAVGRSGAVRGRSSDGFTDADTGRGIRAIASRCAW